MRRLLFVAPLLLAAAPAPKPAALLPDLNPSLILPPPPAAGSPQAAAELAELRWIDANRTPEQFAAAKHDDETKSVAAFADVMGPGFDLARLPATAHMFDIVRATEKAVADRGKAYFLRDRPWIVDPALHNCGRDDEPKSSYPSGHTTMGYSMGGVLARLAPEKAQAVLARSASYGQNRIVCQYHFRSDVAAGEALGLVIAERLMADPTFRPAYDDARRELVAAGLTK